jgi:hypothetical protein
MDRFADDMDMLYPYHNGLAVIVFGDIKHENIVIDKAFRIFLIKISSWMTLFQLILFFSVAETFEFAVQLM